MMKPENNQEVTKPCNQIIRKTGFYFLNSQCIHSKIYSNEVTNLAQVLKTVQRKLAALTKCTGSGQVKPPHKVVLKTSQQYQKFYFQCSNKAAIKLDSVI